MEWEEIKPIWHKVLMVIYADRSKLTRSTSDGGVEGGKITAWRLEQAACNHLFSDHPERFGITQIEGHNLRNFIQESFAYSYVECFHRDFPEIMDTENPGYLSDYVNPERIRKGLNPASL